MKVETEKKHTINENSMFHLFAGCLYLDAAVASGLLIQVKSTSEVGNKTTPHQIN